MARLTHLGAAGEASMVDVGAKDETERTAVAEGAVVMKRETLALILEGTTANDTVGARVHEEVCSVGAGEKLRTL